MSPRSKASYPSEQASLLTLRPDPIDVVRRRIAWLVAQLHRHNYLYHTLDAPEISDAQYDDLFKELETLEGSYPELRCPSSPTLRVGAGLLKGLDKREHSQRMYGLENVFTNAEWRAFVERMARVAPTGPLSFWCDPKLDGLALEIIFENGVFVEALTRGDGASGEVVSHAVRTIKTVPLQLRGEGPFPSLLEVRGEVIIYKNDFAALNHQQEKLGQKIFSNPRNAAAGTVRQLDTVVARSRPLRFLAYGMGRIIWGADNPVRHHHELMKRLKAWGFLTPPEGRLCCDLAEVEDYVASVQASRQNFSMEIDGVVIKQDSFEIQEILGYTARAPRYAVAYKFPGDQAQTLLKRIEIQVGRTGVFTPVAIFEPVVVGGVVVSRASLHNEEEIIRCDLREGDTVIVRRAGEVIPEVVEPVLSMRSANSVPYIFPHSCPACGEKAHKEKGEVAWRCVNLACPAVRLRSVEYFVSKAGLNVQGLGAGRVTQLVQSGRVVFPADLFELSVDDLLKFDGMGKKLAEKFLSSLEYVKLNATLAQLIRALGIRHVGEQTALLLAKRYHDMDDLAGTDMESLQALPDIGPEVASSITIFFSSVSNRTLLARFRALGLWPQNQGQREIHVAGPLQKKSVLFTGTLSQTRDMARQRAEAAGARVVDSVSRKLDYLVVGDKPGGKLEKARALEIAILTEAEFMQLCSQI